MTSEARVTRFSPGVEPYLNLLVTMIMFGSAFASSKVVVGEIPHEVAAALRFGGGAIVLAGAVILLKTGTTRFGASNALRAAVAGLIGVFAYNVLFFWGLSLAPSVDGTVIVPVLSPIFTMAVMLALGKERPNILRIFGLIVGASGAVAFLVAAGGTEDSTRLLGDVVFVVAAACWAFYSVGSKALLTGTEPLQATTWGVCAGAFFLVLYASPHLGSVQWNDVSLTAWMNVIFLAIGPTAIAYFFYYRGLRQVSPTVATLMMFTVPIIGAACAYIFLGERLNTGQIVGAVSLLLGAVLAVAGPHVSHKLQSGSRQ